MLCNDKDECWTHSILTCAGKEEGFIRTRGLDGRREDVIINLNVVSEEGGYSHYEICEMRKDRKKGGV